MSRSVNFNIKVGFNQESLKKFTKDVINLTIYELEKGMKSEKSGIVYSPTYRASAPGEYPAIVSRNLINSIDSEVEPKRIIVGTKAEYAGVLAYGSDKIAPRSMSAEAMQSVMPIVRERLKNFVKFSKRKNYDKLDLTQG